MLALSLFPLLLATTAFAVPSRRQTSNVPASALVLPADQQTLVAPTEDPSFVLLALGNQNLNCSDGKYVNTGADANLFDISPLFPSDEFKKIQADSCDDWLNSFSDSDNNPFDPIVISLIETKYGIKLSGQHHSSEKYGIIYDLTSTLGPDASVVAEVTGEIPPPDSRPNIKWQELKGVSGKLGKTVFSVFTEGGGDGAGMSCAPGDPGNTAKFTAQIWIYGSEL